MYKEFYLAIILQTVSCVLRQPTVFPPPWKYTTIPGAASLSHGPGLYTVTGMPSEVHRIKSVLYMN